jgi:glycosyltransferase involved in cell wall biosynthesis
MASVGNLVPLKGHGIAIRAAAAMPGTELVIAGAGPEEAALKRLIDELNIGDRVRLLGRQSQERLRTLYSAADCLILASEREGCPNVLLEALACGCPVVATRTGGIPEILTVPEAGTMMAERSVGGLIEAVAQLRAGPPVRDATRRYAQMFGWTATTEGQIALFERIRQRADKTEPAARKRLLKELT